MKKRVLATLISAMMLTAALAGCGASAGTPAPAPAAEDAELPAAATTEEAAPVEEAAASEGAAGDVTIWYYWETAGHQEALDHIIQEFNGQQDQVKVQAKYVPFADFKKQLSVGASAGELPDIVILDNPDHASYAAMGIFADITDKF
ncbi:MAG: extracellular solute-binding protein, partial [Lachnospiraceae bacterium]|nr:extracellular solute-binding protein [Lachnospiraceae bacterium]